MTGPMFDKELRVASRHRRHYMLRFAYVCLLAVLVVNLWFMSVRLGAGNSAVVQVSRMGEAGKQIVASIVWFQFVTAQVLAAVLLSDAISGEIRQRTLDALLVTPIGSLRIITGKLLSKLLQLVLLLAISLPLLAVVRVFGGVPWDYMVSTLCITLTAAVFAGSLSLFASVTYRQAYQAVLLVGLWYLVVWGLVAALLVSLSRASYLSNVTVMQVLYLTNPFAAMLVRTQAMIATPTAAGAFLSWPLHCLVILSAAAAVLAVTVLRLRRITLVTILARTERRAVFGKRSARKRRSVSPGRRRRTMVPIVGSPIVWHERRRPLFWSGRRGVIGAALVVGVVVLLVVALSATGVRMGVVALFPLISIFQVLVTVRLAASAAGAITREKEARTWPILLATPLENREIVRGKAMGALRRNLSLILLALLLYVPVYMASPMRGIGPLQWLLAMSRLATGWIGTAAFLVGLGVYLSARLKTTTAAVASTLGVYFGLKFFCCGAFSPLLFLAPGMFGRGAPASGFGGLLLPQLMTVVYTATYVTAGLLLMRAAVRRVRRDVFQ